MRNLHGIALALGCACVSATPPTSENGYLVGALLPFTGGLAASGTNLEHALLMAAEALNAAGGVGGKKVQVIVRDSGTSTTEGLAAATDLIANVHVHALVGPESPDLLTAIQPLLDQYHVPQVVAGVTAPPRDTTTSPLSFRLAPAVQTMAAAVAEQLNSVPIQRVFTVYEPDGYGQSFSNAFTTEFTKLSGVVTQALPIDTVQAIDFAQSEAPAVLLIGYPKDAPSIVQQFWAINPKVRWFFAPPLRTPAFLQNVSSGVLESATGVSPALGQDADVFVKQFQARWAGDTPLVDAYFYFDALLVLGLAAEAAQAKALGATISGDALAQSLVDVSPTSLGSTVTSGVSWLDISQGFVLVQQGSTVSFTGVTGAHVLDLKTPQNEALVQAWTISDGEFVDGQAFFAEP